MASQTKEEWWESAVAPWRAATDNSIRNQKHPQTRAERAGVSDRWNQIIG